jgi:hypothetical protein
MNSVVQLPQKCLLPNPSNQEHAVERIRSTLSQAGLGDTTTQEPLLKPDNPNSVHCTACGRLEYMQREYCRCGAFLRGQLEDQLLEYEISRRRKLLARVRGASQQSFCLYSLGVTSAIMFFIVPLLAYQFGREPLRLYAPITFAVAMGGLALGYQLERKARKLKNMAQATTLNEFLEILRERNFSRGKQATSIDATTRS